MTSSDRRWRRVRVERGIYLQPNGLYSVYVTIDGKPRFRVVEARTIEEARRQREFLRRAAGRELLPASPQLTFGEVARRWLSEFEAKVAAGERRERTLEHYRSALEHHILPRLGHRRLQLIGPDDLAKFVSELRGEGLSAWTINGLLVPLSCVFNFAVRRSYLASNPLRRLHPDERPHPGPSDQRVLSRTELARLLHATPVCYRSLLATAHLLAAGITLARANTGATEQHIDQAERLLGTAPSVQDKAEMTILRSRIATLRGAPKPALALAREALALVAGISPTDEGYAAAALADALTLAGEPDAAHDCYRHAVDLLETQRRWRDAAQSCRAWSRMLRQHGRETEALDALERATELGLRAAPHGSPVRP
jgi:tetratricopeptide (TPR) repeat protein